MLAYSGHVMTLANSIIGVGILAMPFCFQKCGILLSIVLLIISNWVTRVCCHYLIKLSLLTRRKSFEFLGFHAFGTSGKLLAELCIIGYLFGTCVTYFVVVGDLGPQIITKMFTLDVDSYPHLRTWIMMGVTLLCILPLSLLKNVDSLSAVCAASIGFYVCLVVKIVMESEEHIVANDWTEQVTYWRPAGVLQCLPIFSMALSCQMQIFEVFESINNQSLEKLNGIVRSATWICTFVYIAVGFFGYVAFCTQSFSGNILMKISPSFGSDVMKIGFILSVAFSFPLVIFPCRASIYSLLYRKGHTDNTGYIPETRFKVITLSILSLGFCIALMIPSIELIIGLVGSTIGVAICIMFPASCFRRISRKESTERSMAQFIFISGFCLMILGTYANLNAIDEKHSGAHLEVVQNVENVLMLPTEIVQSIEKQKENELTPPKLRLVKPEVKLEIEAKPKGGSLVQNIIKNTNNVEKPTIAPTPPPPLPVDEKHVDGAAVKEAAEVQEIVAKLSVVSPEPDKRIETKVLIEDNALKKSAAIVESRKDTVTVGDTALKEGKVGNAIQTINKDAITKDEEIAAEELKNNQKQAKIDKTEELKETQQELKKTKELLERTVDQLKEELAKQNKETQNLVAEKLDAVVQKVEQIERKVQNQEPAEKKLQPAPLESQKQQSDQLKETPEQQPQRAQHQSETLYQEVKTQAVQQQALHTKKDTQQKENGQQLQKPNEKPEALAEPLIAEPTKNLLLNIIAEKPTNGDAPMAPGQVYEPLSYKTGELIEHAKHGSKLEQRLPLPLAKLLNASNSQKLNDTPKVKTGYVKTLELALGERKQAEVVTAEKLPPKAIEISAAEIAKQEKERENVESIRRDILQLDNAHLKELTTLAPAEEPLRQRFKRAKRLEEENVKVSQKSFLKEPKIEQLLAHGMSNAHRINFKMQNMGREETR